MDNKLKRIMILGAGPFQLPGIRRAAELGYHVISVDYLPENVGHQFSHESLNCSTTAQERLLSLAREAKIDGITTFASDVAVPSVAYLSEELGLRGPSVKTAGCFSRKSCFRKMQQDHQLSHPAFIEGQSFEEIRENLEGLNFPIVFKPVDSSGSRGVTRVERLEEDSCHSAFEKALEHSRCKKVCIEEFVHGVEVGGDAFLVDGEIQFMMFTHKRLNEFVVTGHSVPTNISQSDQKAARHEIAKHCEISGYRDGPINFDVMVTDRGMTVLEMHPWRSPGRPRSRRS